MNKVSTIAEILDGYMRTLHERERVRRVERPIAVLRDRDLGGRKRLSDG